MKAATEKAGLFAQSLPSLWTLATLPLTAAIFFAYELPKQLTLAVLNISYVLAQIPIIFAFKPPLPSRKKNIKYKGRIAVVGAGLTGVSSAAHAVAHGFDVVIYEKSDRIGGIWASVNKTSGLQLNSLLYRFHPAVKWQRAFPHRDEILKEIKRIHKEYDLDSRTRLGTPVTSIKRADGSTKPSGEQTNERSQWVVNDGEDGVFDAVIVTVGTCGEPNMVNMKGMPGWKDKKKHESNRDTHSDPKDTSTSHDRDTVWTHVPKEDRSAVRRDQQEKKQHGFPNPLEAYKTGDYEVDVPTQDNGAHGADLGVWAATKPRENAWDVGRDQVAKVDQGFPKPGEAYETGEDTQMPVEEVMEDKLHEKVSEEGPVTLPRKRDEKTSHGDAAQKERSSQQVAHGDDNDGNVFHGPILHSSGLDHEDAPSFDGKTVVVVGSGASAVEAVETALAKGAKKCVVLARADKWIIPRNIVIDTLISAQPFGREMPLSFLWEKFIAVFNYRGVEDLIPANSGLFESTPVVNDEFLGHVRAGRCDYVRGDTERLTSRGVKVNVRGRDSKPGDKGEMKVFDADIVVMATGFKKPQIDFLPDDLFPDGYERPNLYLQNFATEDWSILMTNSSYMNAIGTVGHFHIGIYARILMTFLMDKNARPTPKDMKLWVDVVRFIKRGAKGGALGFFTYMELIIWLLLFHLLRLDRLKWLFFIMQGWGVHPQYA